MSDAELGFEAILAKQRKTPKTGDWKTKNTDVPTDVSLETEKNP